MRGRQTEEEEKLLTRTKDNVTDRQKSSVNMTVIDVDIMLCITGGLVPGPALPHVLRSVSRSDE